MMTREEIGQALLDIQGKMDAIMQTLNTETPLEESPLVVGDVLKDKDGCLWVVVCLTGEQAWLFSREKGGILTHRRMWMMDADLCWEKTGVWTGMIDDMFDSLSVNYEN